MFGIYKRISNWLRQLEAGKDARRWSLSVADFAKIPNSSLTGVKTGNHTPLFDIYIEITSIFNYNWLGQCAFVQVTATPYALYLQPQFDKDERLPLRPDKTILLPSGKNYIGGKYYFLDSQDDEAQSKYIYENVTECANCYSCSFENCLGSSYTIVPPAFLLLLTQDQEHLCHPARYLKYCFNNVQERRWILS